MPEYSKPLPAPSEDSLPFWRACKEHTLILQRCLDCGSYRFYPRSTCNRCSSANHEWTEVSGEGKVYSFSIVHRAPVAAFQPDIPYVVALIDLKEGPRMCTNIVGCPPEAVKIDMPVRVVFEDVTPEVTLPKFRPAE